MNIVNLKDLNLDFIDFDKKYINNYCSYDNNEKLNLLEISYYNKY